MKVNGISRIMGFEIQIKIFEIWTKRGKNLKKSSDEKKF
jgi:hypothetical protein